MVPSLRPNEALGSLWLHFYTEKFPPTYRADFLGRKHFISFGCNQVYKCHAECDRCYFSGSERTSVCTIIDHAGSDNVFRKEKWPKIDTDKGSITLWRSSQGHVHSIDLWMVIWKMFVRPIQLCTHPSEAAGILFPPEQLLVATGHYFSHSFLSVVATFQCFHSAHCPPPFGC